MGARRFAWFPLAAALAGALLAAPPAQASFHLIKVREVFPGTTAKPNSDYVELQMYASGQSLVQFGELEVLNSAGTVTSKFTPGSSVANSANQRTILFANAEFASQFPGVSPDFTNEGLNLSPAGGAVCWPQTDPPYDDCASWGDFAGQASLPSPGDAAPAVPTGIPDGMALRRSIEPGCPTFLENADDTNNSSVDFSVQEPEPRNNATPPSEVECPSLPNTTIVSKPANPTNSIEATFSFTATPAAGASFECKLDAEPAFTACTSPQSYPGLAGGAGTSHSFEVRAVNSAGTDPTPAPYMWTVDTEPPEAKIKSHPEDHSPGTSVSFTYESTESKSTFECSLVPEGEADAFSGCPLGGRTYSGLSDGAYVFKVRATDAAKNQGLPAVFKWAVENSAPDITPPETTITSKPPDPSDGSTASFTYESNEPGSSFECKLDAEAFVPCPAVGIIYTGLGNGPHTFQVRAIDPSGNVDPMPAGYSFEVTLVASMFQPSPPDTTISARPPARTRDRTPTFRFHSNRAGAVFRCKVDRSTFKPCRSPFTTKRLSLGRHAVRVEAIVAGVADPLPARASFKVVRG